MIGFDKFPLKPISFEAELKLRVFPEYSDTAPFACPKTNQILEEAWPVLAKKFQPDPKTGKPGKGGVVEAIGLYCAIYYDATRDDYVLPALRKFAIETAMGQSGGASWGHTFAYPASNGGQFHRMNPGYGALNAAGNRCFFLIALAKKLGVEHPEIDAAIARGQKFFSSYIDRGAIPYSDHAAAGTDDSNGKNSGIAFALNLLGDKYGAKYFSAMSAHASFTACGGHGHDYHTNWSSWGATLCGPEVRSLAERNMRWHRTLCRRHDGSFVYHSPTGKYGTLRDPTATEVLHQAIVLKQTHITGKDLDESLFLNEREMKQMIATTRSLGACGDDVVLSNLSSLIKLLDDPKEFVRVAVADVLSKNSANQDVQLALLKATVDEPQLVAPNGIRNLTQTILFAADHPLAKSPFSAGFDEKLVETALENLILLDPVGGKGFLGSRNRIWT